jgi:hypothetical protein
MADDTSIYKPSMGYKTIRGRLYLKLKICVVGHNGDMKVISWD